MEHLTITNGFSSLEISSDGHVRALRLATGEVSPWRTPALCELVMDNDTFPIASARLVHHSSTSASFEAAGPFGISLSYNLSIAGEGRDRTAIICTVKLAAALTLQTDVHLKWYWGIRMQGSRLFIPAFDGRGVKASGAGRHRWHYECAGGWGKEPSGRLAIPMIDEEGGGHCVHFTDPFFSSGIQLQDNEPGVMFLCTFLKEAGESQFVERLFGTTIYRGDIEHGINAYFRYALDASPPGPGWIHDIAMVHYDYLSEKGEGWFHDIDKLEEIIPRGDRHRVALTLHGWYDFLGRYSLNRSGRFDRRWSAMPGSDRIEMSVDEIHRRLGYAKERGFRVLLYFADGLAVDAASPDFDWGMVFTEPDGSPRKHHWTGPDTLQQTYILNPVHPGVQDFFRRYLRALLDEFGDEIDGLNWDETFTVKAGDIARGNYPGYADRTFLLLCKELRTMVKSRNAEMVLLASDCTGLSLPQEDGSYWKALPAQNALVFDGTYQDSHCNPGAWQYALFPAFRNVVWSCNWKPVTNFEWTIFGVKAFGAPVAISNGWGDCKGVSQYSSSEIRRLMDLFEWRKTQRGRVRWIEFNEIER